MKKFYLNLKLHVLKTVIFFSTVLILLMFGNSALAQTTTVNLTTPGANSWTVPCGVTSLTVEAWGGGGAGGSATIVSNGGSGGGGGGGYSTYTVGVTPGQIINYTIGSGGSGGSGNGGDGSATTILALTANGGTGGFQDQGTAGSGGTASGGTTNTTGGNGTIGSATTGEAGGNGANGGIGGPAITTESNGNDGTAPGGGGGGGLLLAGAGPSNGGNGGSGQITITYNTPAVLAAPTPVTPSSGISICNGKSTNLNATSAGNTINWYTVPTGGTSIGSSASGVDFSVSPTADTTYYAEAESSPGCVSATRTATGLVTVTALPVITAQPVAPAAVCAGNGTRTIDVTATGTSLTYQWRKNGTNLTNGAPYTNVTTASMSITNPAISENGASFDVVITDAQGCDVTSNAVALTVNALPAITTQPATPTTSCSGTGTKNISVTATGTSLTYQWRKNGTNLTNTAPYSNVTTATMTITSPAFSENGASFDVVVTNAQGCTITSNAVVLTVNPPATAATLVTPNTPQNICNGTSINLNGTSAGNTIFWFAVPTGGPQVGSSASGANLSVTPANNTTITYYADARTAAGCFSATRTATATITTSAGPTISVQPVAPAAVCAGSGTRTISITSTATTWQWRRNGVDLTNTAPYSGVTTATLTITNPATTDAGTFTVVLNGGTCPLTSNSVALTVNALPSAPTGVTPSSPVNACTTAGTTPLNATSLGNTIDWYTVATGGTSIGSSASGANFLVSAPTATVYYAESKNAATGCVSSTRTATASVTSNVLPSITTQPATPAATCAGSGTVTITVATTGATSIQWRKNGTNLTNTAPYSGVTTNTLTITNPPIGDNGASFDVVINNSNATCPVTSNSVTLTVNPTPSAPTSVTPSTPSTICGTANITLNATSAGNTIYWYTAATGGTSIGNSASGANLAVSPTSTVTYYAEARTALGCSSLTRTATATMTINPTPVVTIEFTENMNDKSYSIAACGHIAASENDIDIASGNPAGENATTFGPTATGQWQVSYDNQATWQNAPGPTSTQPQYLFDPAYSIFETTPGTYHFRLILTVNGCPGTSDVITLTTNGNPTLTSGSIAADQSSCPTPYNPAAFTQTAAATVATPISGYNFTYQWQSSTDNVNFTNIGTPSATTTYDAPSISVTTYYRRYAIYGSAGGGCSAVSNTITVTVGSLAAPTVGTITQPNCSTATGSVVLSGLPASGTWTLNRSGTSSLTTTGTGASTTITLAAGTYTFTVSQSTCTSPATVNVVINAQPSVPAIPTASVTAQPTCATPKGTITVTAPIAANISYTLTGTAPVVAPVTQTGTTFANLNPGTYTLYTTNTTSTCTSTTITLTVNAIPSTPAPTISNTAASCASAGTSTISNYNAGFTYAFTPAGPTAGAGGLISGMTIGTSYTVRATNGSCTQSAASASFSIAAQLPTPAVPTTNSTAASCSAAGTSTISNYAAGNTYTFTPTGPTVAAGGAISGMTVGTSYTVTATSGGCTSAASASFSNATQLPTPAVPTISSVAANCSAAGTSTISNYGAGITYTFTPTGPTVAAGGAISGMTVGTSYTVTATSGGCTSAASASFSNAAQLPSPAVPTINSTAASCSAAGTSTISNYAAGNTYAFTPTGPTVGAGGAISGMTAGTSYTVTATSGGCTSAASASFSNADQLTTPAIPTLTVSQNTCLDDGTSTINNYVSSGIIYTFTPTGPTVGAGGTISGMILDTPYTVTASNGSCTSPPSISFTNVSKLPAPTAPVLTLGTINCNDFSVDWAAIPNATGYRIDVATDAGFTNILPAYNNLSISSAIITENITGVASGFTFYVRIREVNSCGTSANSNTLTVTTGSSNTAFTTDVVQPNCVLATGKITVNESVVDPSDQYSFDDGVTYQSSNVKDLLAAGTYKVRIKNTNGCETLATTIVLNPTVTTTYSGTWSNGVPTSLTKAIFASNYTFSSDIQACSCEVNAGVTVTVNPGFSLVLENGIDVLGSGSIIFENNSSLIQTNNVVNTGNITYKRNTTPVGKFDYTYWSSPVSPQTLLNVSPTTLSDKYFSWDSVGGVWKVEAPGTVMGKGVGYIIRGPQANLTPAVHTASFVGVPNNGTITVSIAGSGLDYLIGNPYPSALDAEAFLGANPVLDGTIYFWTHNTAITQSGNFYVYNSNDYASYNAVGGTGTTAAAANSGVNNSIPSGRIASGQAFFATSNAAGTVTFENTMRVGSGGAILNNSQFFKGTKEKATAELKKHRVWLNLSNTEGAFKQMLIGYVTTATNGFDNRFDGKTMDSNTYVDFYSINESNKLTIQGRALPFDILDQVPLGYKTTIEGTFSINIDQVDGILASIPIFLEDKSTGTVVNLKNGAYSFSTVAGTFDDRFVLRYINSSIKIPDFTTINFDEWIKKVLVSVKNHRIKINSYDQTIDNVTIFDLSRRKIYEKGNINSNEFNVPEFSSANQFLMVQIRLKNGKLVTEKIIF